VTEVALGWLGSWSEPSFVVSGLSIAGAVQLGGAAVRQSGPAAIGVEVAGWELDSGAPVGEEHRAAAAAFEQPGQQPGGAGPPDDHVDRVCL